MGGFLVPLLLAGLGAVTIPPLIHLLNRRRFDVVDWGAMQFLQISETTRRRLLIEEILLMALRMGLIAVLVLAMAGPFLFGSLLPGLAPKPNRDVVLILDGSYSMSYTEGGPSAHDEAKQWALDFLKELSAGDSVAILQGKQQVVTVITPTVDLEAVRKALDKMPAPAGGCDWPMAMTEAHELLLANGHFPNRDIIILTDGQRHGWSDDDALLGWKTTANKLARERIEVKPRVTVINVAPKRPADPPNWSLATLESSRAVAAVDREVRFNTALQVRGQKSYQPPYRVRLEVDGQYERDLETKLQAELGKEGQVPLRFTHKFAKPGSHLVSVIVEPDPPIEKRPPGYVPRDYLPGDNRQDFALEVLPAIPVMIVDGDERTTPSDPKARARGCDFLQRALSPSGEPPAVQAVVVPLARFDERSLAEPLNKAGTPKPRVIVLFNVPRLTDRQQEAVTKFIAAGGGVLVTLGDRCDSKYYNDALYKGGEGWLPARLGDIEGDETDLSRSSVPLPKTFQHPALELFKDNEQGGLADARFPRWWKLIPPAKTTSVTVGARLNTGDPLFVEKTYQNGRVLMCAVPMDDSWRTNLPRLQTGAFLPLAHELVYSLAGASSSRQNLKAGQHIRYTPSGYVPPSSAQVKPPQGEVKEQKVERWPLDYPDTREAGVYQVAAGGNTTYFVVTPDARESNLTPSTEEDRKKVSDLIPMQYKDDKNVDLSLAALEQKQELWFWLLIGVIVLLCGEVWLTRRIVLSR